MSIGGGIVKGALFLGVENLASSALGIVFLVLFVRLVGAAGFGAWSVAYAVASVAGIPGSGLHLVLERFLPEYLEGGDHTSARRLTSGVLGAKLVLAAGVAVTLPLVAPVLAAHFDGPELAPLIRVFGLWVVADSLAATGRSLLLGLQHFSCRLGVAVLQALINVATVLAALWTGGGLLFVTWGFLASSAVAGAIQVPFAYRLLHKTPRPEPEEQVGGRPLAWSRILRYGLPLTINGGLFQLYLNLGKLLLGYFVGPQGAGVFALASGVLERVTGLSSAIASALLPSFSRLAARADTSSFNRYGRSAIRFSIVLGAATSAFLFIFAREISLGLGGGEFVDAVLVLQVLSFQALPRVPALSLASLLYTFEATAVGMFVSAGRLLAELALYSVLIPLLAERGAAGAQAGSYALAFGALVWALRRRMALTHRVWVVTYLWAAAAITPLLLVSVLVDRTSPSLLAGLALKAGASTALFSTLGVAVLVRNPGLLRPRAWPVLIPGLLFRFGLLERGTEPA